MMPKNKPPENEIAAALAACKGAFISVGAFSAIINLLMLAPSLYMLQVYDRVLASRNETTLLVLTLLVLAVFVCMNALEFVRSWVLIRVSARLDMQMNQRVYTAAFEQNLTGAKTNAGQPLNDLTSIRQFLTGNGVFAFFDAPWFPVYLLVIFLFDVTLGVYALCGALLLVALAFVNELVSRKPLAEASSMAIVASNHATNDLRNAEVIEAMGMLPNMLARWVKVHGRFLQLQAQASEKAGIVGAATKFVRVSLQSLILGFAALLVLEGKITGGMMIVASVLMGRALNPVEQVINAWRTWSSARSAYFRLQTLLGNYPARKIGMRLPDPLGHVSLEAVTAAPPGSETAVIKGLGFALVPGDVLGVVGPSGAGKSTLARLIVGVWPAAAGHVRLDGADVFTANKDVLGPHIGYLPQDIELFAGSVSENIGRFGAIDAEKVVLAAKRTGVHEMILRLPQGYDTLLGVDGAGLSGGQKQRIGLARALYGDPALLVLDEPNSNLDEAGEQALIAAISDLRERGKTIVVISHRTTIIAITSNLLLLIDGVAKMFGPTKKVLEELAKANQQLAPQGPRVPPGRGPGTQVQTITGG